MHLQRQGQDSLRVRATQGRCIPVAFGLDVARVVASLVFRRFMVYRLMPANIVSGFWQRAVAHLRCNGLPLPDNPYDGHTLNVSITGAEKITKVLVQEADVDRGYRGHDYQGTATIRIAGSSNKGLSASEKKRKRRRSSVEPVIGHLKSDHRLDRCFFLFMPY